MGRGLLLWLIGIPIPIILLIWLFGGLHFCIRGAASLRSFYRRRSRRPCRAAVRALVCGLTNDESGEIADVGG